MNYAVHYDRLMDRARVRVLEGYRERHHVIPKCMGGANAAANIVALTAEEHYVAHQLLVKIHPSNGSLAIAANVMGKRCSGCKVYGWLRRRMAQAKRGQIVSAETREKIGAASRGKKLTPEHIAKVAAAQRGRIFSDEHRDKLALAKIGKKLGPRKREWVEKIAASLRGKKRAPFSAEWRAKMAASQRARCLHEGKVLR